MTVVLDTNVLVRMFGQRSELAPLKRSLLDGQLIWAVSTPILLEYEEVIRRYGGPQRWTLVERALKLISAVHGSLRTIAPTYRFLTITGDPDDDIFADCAIVADADHIITSDHHFDAMRGKGYKPQPIAPEDFVELHLGEG